MVKIYSRNLIPINNDFYDKCKDEIIKNFYNQKSLRSSRKFIDKIHKKYLSNKIDNKTKAIFIDYLKSVGIEATDKPLYLLFMLQKVGEDKLKDSFSYRAGLFSGFRKLPLKSYLKKYDIKVSDEFYETLRENFNISAFVAQSVLFAIGIFIRIWRIIKEE